MITIASVSPECVYALISSLMVTNHVCQTLPNTYMTDLNALASRHFLSHKRPMALRMIAFEAQETRAHIRTDFQGTAKSFLSIFTLEMLFEYPAKNILRKSAISPRRAASRPGLGSPRSRKYT